MKFLCIAFAILFFNEAAFAKALITKEAVHTAKKETRKFRLKNRIPVIYRKVEGSDILHMNVSFSSGSRDLPLEERPQNSLLFSTMPSAAKGYPKKKLFEITENYGLILGCSGGIETSSCELGTVNDYWKEGLDLLAAVILSPAIEQDDLNLEVDRYVAGIKSEMSDPNSYANNIVNKVFYPKNHPYAGTYEDLLEHAPKVKREDLLNLHKQILTAENIVITVVGSMDEDQITKSLSSYFGSIPQKERARPKVDAPTFVPENSFAFEDRKVPTAYIRIKFNNVGITDENSTAAKFLARVLSEELSDEIRTRQSLSYAVHSYTVQLSTGIGVISVSTSKPKEALAAIKKVIEKVKNSRFSKTEFDNHKRIYTTSYYLTQEEHSSLANALAHSELWFNSTDPLYEMPLELERVTSRELQSLAKKLLVNFRIGVVYEKSKFKEKWAKSLIQYSVAAPKQKG